MNIFEGPVYVKVLGDVPIVKLGVGGCMVGIIPLMINKQKRYALGFEMKCQR
jgi:hypothetical protein